MNDAIQSWRIRNQPDFCRIAQNCSFPPVSSPARNHVRPVMRIYLFFVIALAAAHFVTNYHAYVEIPIGNDKNYQQGIKCRGNHR